MADQPGKSATVRRFFQRREVRLMLLFSLLHYAALVLLNSLIFLLAHLPPSFIPIDPLIVGLTWLDQALRLPRTLLRHLWPGETTATWLNYFLTVANSLAWGAILAELRILLHKPEKHRPLLS